jgi:hypothetical protein
LSGVRVSGGPVRAGGGSTSGRVDFLTGGTSGGVRAYETRQGGRLAAAGVWYEGTPTANAPYVELTSASGGNLALAAHLVSFIQPTQPFARTTDYAGQLSLLASRFDHRDSTRIAFTGAGSSTRVLGAGLQYALLTDPNPTKPIDQIWLDSTSPNGEIANLTGDYPNYTNKTIGGYPSTAFVQQQLSLLRGIRTTHATAQATGVTDVKLLRVGIVAGNNRAALRITRD